MKRPVAQALPDGVARQLGTVEEEEKDDPRLGEMPHERREATRAGRTVASRTVPSRLSTKGSKTENRRWIMERSLDWLRDGERRKALPRRATKRA